MSFHSLEEIRMFCERKSVPFWKAVQLSDMDERGVTEEESLRMMEEMWDAMKSAEENYDGERMSHSGLTAVSYTHLPESTLFLPSEKIREEYALPSAYSFYTKQLR